MMEKPANTIESEKLMFPCETRKFIVMGDEWGED